MPQTSVDKAREFKNIFSYPVNVAVCGSSPDRFPDCLRAVAKASLTTSQFSWRRYGFIWISWSPEKRFTHEHRLPGIRTKFDRTASEERHLLGQFQNAKSPICTQFAWSPSVQDDSHQATSAVSAWHYQVESTWLIVTNEALIVSLPMWAYLFPFASLIRTAKLHHYINHSARREKT